MAVLGFTPLELRTYVILSLCWLSIVQVNLLEQPYARSLVVCDVPVNKTEGAEFSGSRYCGDRLHVINVGAEISGYGQSLENAGRIAITLFVSAYADRGRKQAAILGQSLILSSTLLFFLAGFLSTGWAIPIYALAQGLQGMSGIGILDPIVTADVALQLGDEVGVYQRRTTFMLIMNFIFLPTVAYVQYAQFTDFTMVWLGINLLNTGALVLLLSVFPETMSKDKIKGGEFNILQIVTDELSSFWRLLSTNALVKYRLAEMFMQGMADPSCIIFPFLMANFGMTQFGALAFGGVPVVVLAPAFMPIANMLHKRLSYRVGWVTCYWSAKALTIFSIVLPIPGYWFPRLRSFYGIPGPIFYGIVSLVNVGFPPIVTAVETRMVGLEMNAKYQAMAQLTGFVSGVLSSTIITKLFDAEAVSDVAKCTPYLYCLVWELVQLPLWVRYLAPLQLPECDKLTAEMRAEAAKGPEDTKKTD